MGQIANQMFADFISGIADKIKSKRERRKNSGQQGNNKKELAMAEIKVNAQSSIRIGGSKVVRFDPFKIEDELHDADIIFVTHEHFDHFSPEDIAKVAKKDTVLAAPVSMKKAVESAGLGIEKFVFVNTEESGNIGGVEYSCVRAYNVGKPFHTKESGWVGYIAVIDGVKYFVTGDTDANEDNIKVKCDVLFVPCGGKYTFDAVEAAEFAAKIAPKKAIPTHYGNVVGSADDGKIFAKKLAALKPETEVEILL